MSDPAGWILQAVPDKVMASGYLSSCGGWICGEEIPGFRELDVP